MKILYSETNGVSESGFSTNNAYKCAFSGIEMSQCNSSTVGFFV